MNTRNTDSLECEIMNKQKSELLAWVIEWLKCPNKNFNSNNIDASELASLMQCLGFTLDKFEKLKTAELPEDFDENVITITVQCNKSRTKVVLNKPLKECNCPQRENANNAYIWNVTGCEPQSEERINVSNTSILPVVSPKKNKIITELLQKVLVLINDPDIDEKIKTEISQKCFKEETNNAQKIEIITEDAAKDEKTEKCEETNEIKLGEKGRKALDFNGVATSRENLNSNSEKEAEEAVVVSPPVCTSSPLDAFGMTPNMKSAPINLKALKSILENISKYSEEGLEWIERNELPNRKKKLSDIKKRDDANTPFKGDFINMNRTQVKEFSLRPKTPTPLSQKKVNTPTERKTQMNPPSRLVVPRKLLTPTSRTQLKPRSDTPIPSLVNTQSGKNSPMGVSRLKQTSIPKKR